MKKKRKTKPPEPPPRVDLPAAFRARFKAAVFFHKAALTEGEHPVALATQSERLAEAGIDPAVLTPEFLYRTVKETAEPAFVGGRVRQAEEDMESKFYSDYWQSFLRQHESSPTYYSPEAVLSHLWDEHAKRLSKDKTDFVARWECIIPKGVRCFVCGMCGFRHVMSDQTFAALARTGENVRCFVCHFDKVVPPALLVGPKPKPRIVSIPAPVVQTRKLERTVGGVEVFSEPGKSGGKRFVVMGLRVPALIRWFGSAGWTEANVRTVLRRLGIGVKDTVLQKQMSLGKSDGAAHGGRIVGSDAPLWALLPAEPPKRTK